MGRCLSEIIDMSVTALRASGVRADQAFNGPFDIVVEQSRIEALESQLASQALRIDELKHALQQSKSVMSIWRDQSGNDQHLTGTLDVSEVMSANWQLARVELPRVASERDSERARAEKAERLADELRVHADELDEHATVIDAAQSAVARADKAEADIQQLDGKLSRDPREWPAHLRRRDW